MLNKILITIGIIIAIFLVGLVTDVIRGHFVKRKVERCLEEVIKKGAVLIDTPLQAKEQIKEEAKGYSLSLTDNDIIISSSLNRIIIAKSLSIRTYFAWIVGKKELKLHVQKQADILRTIQPITELETISLGIIRPKGLNFGFLYKLTTVQETGLLEEKLVGLDFELGFSKTIKVGNILKLRKLEEGELEELMMFFMRGCKMDCRMNKFYHKCPKLLKIPVVEPFKPIPSMVKVVGFACFFIEGVDDEKVTGYFVIHYQPGISDDRVSNDFGLRTRSKIEVTIKHQKRW
ncbi:MAG: hypothetical protein AB1567_12775 [bacterium]